MEIKKFDTHILRNTFSIVSVAMAIVTILFHFKFFYFNLVRILTIVNIFNPILKKLWGKKINKEDTVNLKNELRYSKFDRYGNLRLKPNQIEVLEKF